jgi:hypothetical protein
MTILGYIVLAIFTLVFAGVLYGVVIRYKIKELRDEMYNDFAQEYRVEHLEIELKALRRELEPKPRVVGRGK